MTNKFSRAKFNSEIRSPITNHCYWCDSQLLMWSHNCHSRKALLNAKIGIHPTICSTFENFSPPKIGAHQKRPTPVSHTYYCMKIEKQNLTSSADKINLKFFSRSTVYFLGSCEQNGMSLFTPVSDSVLIAPSDGTFLFPLHGTFKSHQHKTLWLALGIVSTNQDIFE